MLRWIQTSTLLLLVLPHLLLGGCASASVEIGVTTRAERYLDFGDPNEMLLAEPPRCAVLPSLSSANHGRAVVVDMALDKAFRVDYRPFSLLPQDKKAQVFTVVSHEEVARRIVQKGKTEELQKIYTSIDPTGIPDPKALAEIARILEVEYLLFPRLISLSTDNASRFTFTGLTFIRTGWISAESSLQLWHGPSGELAWQSTGQGSLTAENVVGISPPAQSVLDGLLTTLIGDLVTGRDSSVVSGKIDAPPSANPTNVTAGNNTVTTVTTVTPSSSSTPTRTEDPLDSSVDPVNETPDAGATKSNQKTNQKTNQPNL
jgi:hypothetical protein